MHLSDQDAFVLSQRYWVPRQFYGQAAALKLWQEHAQKENFGSWEAPGGSDSHRYQKAVEQVSRDDTASEDFLVKTQRAIEEKGNSALNEDELLVVQVAKLVESRRKMRAERQTGRVFTPDSEIYPGFQASDTQDSYTNNDKAKRIRLVTKSDRESQYWGHRPGDHMFRLLADQKGAHSSGDALTYEGQIPRDPREHAYRFKVIVLPQIISMVICLLSFNPVQKMGVPDELQQILDKKGDIDHGDTKLLREIWLIKFTDEDKNGAAENIWPRDIMAGNPLHDQRVSFRCQEAAWLMETLAPHQEDFAFCFDDLLFFLGRITGVPPQALPRMYLRSTEREARQMLAGNAGSSSHQVLVYRNVENNGAVTRERDAQIRVGSGAAAPVNRNGLVSPAPVSQDPLWGSEFLRFYQHLNADLTPALEAARRIEQQQRTLTTQPTQHRRSTTSSPELDPPFTTQFASPPTRSCTTTGETAPPDSSNNTRSAESRYSFSPSSAPESRHGVAVTKRRVKKQRAKKQSTASYRKTIERFFVI